MTKTKKQLEQELRVYKDLVKTISQIIVVEGRSYNAMVFDIEQEIADAEAECMYTAKTKTVRLSVAVADVEEANDAS